MSLFKDKKGKDNEEDLEDRVEGKKVKSDLKPYYETKGIISREIAKYIKDNDMLDVKLPEFEYKRQEDYNKELTYYKTTIKIDRPASLDLGELLKIPLTILGPGELEYNPYYDEPEFKKNELSILSGKTIGFEWIRMEKKGNLTEQEINTIIEIYKTANPAVLSAPEKTAAELGIIMYDKDSEDALDWDYIAGYDEIKKQIQNTIILPLKNPDVYDSIVSKTRKVNESIKPKAVLLEGPPGTGKTTIARILGKDIDAPLIYAPIESINTKWYGESERNLARIFKFARSFEGTSVIFLDEIDSLGSQRNENTYESARRVLSVLLKEIDGFESSDKTLIIGSTNRAYDLDPALVSRFDLTLNIPLPNQEERAAIFGNYAKHLPREDLEYLASNTEDASGRDIKDICEHAERTFAADLIAEKIEEETPTLKYYKDSLAIKLIGS